MTTDHVLEFEVMAEGLRFPEGPVVMADGSVLVVEIDRGTLTRVGRDGSIDVVADCGGGPNGAAIGPDGAAYITNNGGCFEFIDLGTVLLPGPVPSTWTGGSIQRVDLASGEVTTLYTECEGRPLRAPNDLAFDDVGGFWFTDHGVRLDRTSDRTGVFYAQPDGSSINEVVFPLDAPNGVGLSPDQRTLYVAETHTGRLWSWPVPSPGTVEVGLPINAGGSLLYGAPGMRLFDSLAVDGDGWVSVGTLGDGGITSVSPDGTQVEFYAIADDPIVTNICFGPPSGPDGAEAFITSSGTGRLLRAPWTRAPLR